MLLGHDSSIYFHVADDRRDLNKVCDSLISFEVTREDLLRQAETEVDSTTEETYSPMKKPKKVKTIACSQKTKKALVQEKKKVALSKVEAAKIRAKEIFNQMTPDIESDSEDDNIIDTKIEQKFREQEQKIENLTKQLQEKCELMCLIYTAYACLNLTGQYVL